MLDDDTPDATMTMTKDIPATPSFDGERLLFACYDPFDQGRYTVAFSDGTALLVLPGGTASPWLEDEPEVQLWTRGPRVAWAWVPAPVRAEAHRRCEEVDDVLRCDP